MAEPPGEWFDLLLFEPDRLTSVLERNGWRIAESHVPERASSYVIIAEATGSP
jgi:hypothetical protein